jgi:DNA-binding PucR family transcriptional regulator
MSSRRLVLRGSSESLELRLVAAAPADDPDGLATAERLATFLDRTVAVSRPFNEPGARPAAEAAARATLEAADLLPEPDRPRVVRASRLPAYLLLGNVRNLPDGVRQARELLAPILVGRDEVQQERLETLAAVLSSPSLGEAAVRLGVHRNTIAYRVQRLEERADWDLSDPELRVALLLAVRVMQNAQEPHPPPILTRNPVA